jgi:hypothetical protein
MPKSPRTKISHSRGSPQSAPPARLTSVNAQAPLAQASDIHSNPIFASSSEIAATSDVQPLISADTNMDGDATGTPAILITAAPEDDESHTSEGSNLTPMYNSISPKVNRSSCECAPRCYFTWHMHTHLSQVRKDGSFRVLCIDGGGFCCLSAILTLTHLLGTVNYGKSDASPRPCEHFDLICGVGSGGLVAILFGVLEMRCDEAMDAYVHLGRLAFEEEEVDGKVLIAPRGSDRHEFRKELERLVEKHLGEKGAIMNSARSRTSCRVSFLNLA